MSEYRASPWKNIFRSGSKSSVEKTEAISDTENDTLEAQLEFENRIQKIEASHQLQRDQLRASIRDLEEQLHRLQLRIRRIPELEEQVEQLEAENRRIQVLQEQVAITKSEHDKYSSLESTVKDLEEENLRLREELDRKQLHTHLERYPESEHDATESSTTRESHDIHRSSGQSSPDEGYMGKFVSEDSGHTLDKSPPRCSEEESHDGDDSSFDFDADPDNALQATKPVSLSSSLQPKTSDFTPRVNSVPKLVGTQSTPNQRNCDSAIGSELTSDVLDTRAARELSVGESAADSEINEKAAIHEELSKDEQSDFSSNRRPQATSSKAGDKKETDIENRKGGVPRIVKTPSTSVVHEHDNRDEMSKNCNEGDGDDNDDDDDDSGSIGDSLFDIGSEKVSEKSPEYDARSADWYSKHQSSAYNTDDRTLSKADDYKSFGDSLFGGTDDDWSSKKCDDSSVGDSLFDEAETDTEDKSICMSLTSSIVTIEDGIQQTLGRGLSRTRSEKMFAERKSCVDSIRWLARHLPESVVATIIEDVEKEEESRSGTTNAAEYSLATEGSSTSITDLVKADRPNQNSNLNPEARDSQSETGGDRRAEMGLQRRPSRRWSMSTKNVFSEKLDQDANIYQERRGSIKRRGSFAASSEKGQDSERVQILDQMREERLEKRKESLRRLSIEMHTPQVGHDKYEKIKSSIKKSTPDPILVAKHDCALLFVDISGFTKLSTTLDVEPLSKAINTYFQIIIEEVESCGGDIIKFAGDALFAEWQVSDSKLIQFMELAAEESVLNAATCASKIVEKCSDFPVYSDDSDSSPTATLNLHCGLGFGEVVGLHAGDMETRMEYLLLGGPIDQVTAANSIAGHGEVGVSPKALRMLRKCTDFGPELQKRVKHAKLDSENAKSVVIAKKEKAFFSARRTEHNMALALPEYTMKPRERLARRCERLNLPALKRLQRRISQYVHPVIVNDERAMRQYGGDHSRYHERLRSESELRQVCTVFIMPTIEAKLTGDESTDAKLLRTLNGIMIISNRELARFKGQLRQFIIDDKGVVVVANFGLRASTFPNMVSERALPFTKSVARCLETDLGIQCRIGATYGEAYCGVVGAVSRHEYAVLGPSVNLAARLMANPYNDGVLVDNGIKEHSGAREFRALPPITAKGYSNLVSIFEPLQQQQRVWKEVNGKFVGRERERAKIVSIAEEMIMFGGSSKFVFVTADSGAGKSFLCSQVTKQIHEICVVRNAPHLISRNVCTEGDSFSPFNIIRLILLDILDHNLKRGESDQDGIGQTSAMFSTDRREADVAPLLVHFVSICRELKIPPQQFEIICRIMMGAMEEGMTSLSDDTSDTTIGNLARVFLYCSLYCDLVVLALDDVLNMDEMSWKVIQKLFENGVHFLALFTSRPVASQDLHVDGEFWDYLRRGNHGEVNSGQRFFEISLSPMDRSDLDRLIADCLGDAALDIDEKLSHDLFVRSGGMPHLATELVEKLNTSDLLEKLDGIVRWRQSSQIQGQQVLAREDALGFHNLGELVLYRLDSLNSSVRTHLNLAAILGDPFELVDVVTAFERYRMVKEEDIFAHAKSVHQSLEEAVGEGILEEVVRHNDDTYAMKKVSQHPYALNSTTYKFTHDLWRTNILHRTLDESKKDMQGIIAASKFEEAWRKLESLTKNGGLDRSSTHERKYTETHNILESSKSCHERIRRRRSVDACTVDETDEIDLERPTNHERRSKAKEYHLRRLSDSDLLKLQGVGRKLDKKKKSNRQSM